MRKRSKAKAMCERSGFIYPRDQMVIEPGTGLLVHRSESDGMWNRVDHPQNFAPRPRKEGMGFSRTSEDVRTGFTDEFIMNENGGVLLNEWGGPIYEEQNEERLL